MTPFRISMRCPAQSDAPALAAAVQESVAEIALWMSWCHAAYGEQDATNWIDSTLAARLSGAAYEFLIVDVDDRIVGVCGVNHVNAVDRFANLGYWVRSTAMGQGIAPRAVLLVAEWTFANTNLNRLEIVVAEGNARSQRVAEKSGAKREAILRQRMIVGGHPVDAVMHSLVRPKAD